MTFDGVSIKLLVRVLSCSAGGGQHEFLLFCGLYSSVSHRMRQTPVLYVGRQISNAHSDIFCQRSTVAMHAQCVLVATTLLHSDAKFHSFFYNGSKTAHVNVESCYGGM